MKGKPKDDILGLPHTEDGYKEAKRILGHVHIYGKDRKVHKALNKELEELPVISSIHRINSVHDFYYKLSRDEEINFCAKFGPHSVREVLIQEDDNWEEWDLEDT